MYRVQTVTKRSDPGTTRQSAVLKPSSEILRQAIHLQEGQALTHAGTRIALSVLAKGRFQDADQGCSWFDPNLSGNT